MEYNRIRMFIRWSSLNFVDPKSKMAERVLFELAEIL